MSRKTPPVKVVTTSQFEVNPAGWGYEVLDTTTGHQVSGTLPFEAAVEQARNLNGDISYSRRALERALCA